MENHPNGPRERSRQRTFDLGPVIGLTALVFVLGASAGIGGTVAYEDRLHISHPPLGGEVTCRSGAVVGIWVEPHDGSAGSWADWQPEPSDPRVARFIKYLSGPGAAVTVDVGCGGTPQHWEHNDRALNVPVGSGAVNLECVDNPGEKFGSCAVKP